MFTWTMEENRVPYVHPIPLPRNRVGSKTPVPLPRRTVTMNEERLVENEESKVSKSPPVEQENNLRKSLRNVTNNVQELTNAISPPAKNIVPKIESSVHAFLSKRHTMSGLGETKNSFDQYDNARCQSLPDDDLLRSITYESPRPCVDSASIYSEPPTYPPPPLPDESVYDELRPSRPCSEVSPTDRNSIYEEIHDFRTMSGACSPCPSSDEPKTLDRSDSWNYYDIPLSLGKPRGPSYENVALEYLPTDSSQNIYSDEPAKNQKVFKKPVLIPSDASSVCSSKVVSNENYENWLPSTVPRRPISVSSRSEKSFASKSVIYEFDPLFMNRSAKKNSPSPVEEEKQETPQPMARNNEIQKSCTVPSNLNTVPEDTVDQAENSGEYFIYHKTGASKGLLDEKPQEIPVLTQGKKIVSLVRWDSMKKAIKMVTDAAPWSPIMGRKNKITKDDHTKFNKLGKVHNGYLFKSPSNGEKIKDFVKKWCQLADGCLALMPDKNSTNKEIIDLEAVLSIQTIVDTKQTSDGDTLHCWEISTSCRNKPYLLGSHSSTESRLWMRKLLESLTDAFPASLTTDYCRAGQCFLKEGVSSDWCFTWILLVNRALHYCPIGGQLKEIDLRKARCIVLSEDEGKCTETSESGAYIKVHTAVEEVLYIQMDCLRETRTWYNYIKTSALSNGAGLAEQQLTKDYVPVIVDKCINFVCAHGSMSEGIYRRSGSSSKVSMLLSLLRKDAWEVQLSRTDYTEYDVSSVLKRFFMDLPEPLLTKSLYKYFCNVASTKCLVSEKETMYRNYLGMLPQVNYVTLRRLIGHLYFLHGLADKNKMPVENLSAIWAPTLMHVEGKDGMQYTKKECEVISELILNYKSVFLVEEEEFEREMRIQAVLERVHESPNTLPPPRPSGDLKVSIYIFTRIGDSITIPVNPHMDSGVVCTMLAGKTEYAPHELCLTECVLGGTLSRPLHHSESVFETVLKWAYWEANDSRDAYLLLTHNVLYKEILPLAKPPISKSGELKFADRKTKSFKNYMFEFSQAKLRYYKDKACAYKINEWKIEDIIWYIGHEPKRDPQTRWAITFIEKKNPSKRSKELPYFGNTIAGASKEDNLHWIAALLLGQYQYSDLFLKQSLLS